MQDPNEDTEWNDVLRAKGILPPKKEKEITEDEVISMIEETIENKLAKKTTLEDDELDELLDEESEAAFNSYRKKRLAELKAMADRCKFGSVIEITASSYISEVNKAGSGVWVVLHLYKQGMPLCSLINEYMKRMALKYPMVKFIKAIAITCIPNYPEKNVPTLFTYYEGDLKNQLVGAEQLRGNNLTEEEFEYMLGQLGVINTNIKEDPKPRIRDKLFSDLASNDWE